MDMGPLPDSDPEGKLPFLCSGCACERSRKEYEEREARYQANKIKEEQIKSSIDAYLATLPKMSSSDRSEHFRIAYEAAYNKAYGLPSVRAAGGGGR
jgi:hypothetical protein